MINQFQIPYRIRIGVTGHRTLNDISSLKICLQNTLDTGYLEAFTPEAKQSLTQAKAPSVVFSVISPLAEGADRLVACSVMENGGLLEALLPMPLEEYIKDFATSESRQEFIDLLARAHRLAVTDCGVSNAAPDDRNKAYRRAGEDVLERCDILIALWDGQPSRGLGGTAEIIELAVSSKKPVFIISTSEPGRMELKNGGTLTADFIEEINSFNKLQIEDDELNTYIDNACSDLFPSRLADNIPGQFKCIVRERLIPPYCGASRKAKYFQECFTSTGLQGYVFATLSVFVMAFAVVFNAKPFISLPGTILELLLLMILFEMIHRAEHEKVHPGWLEHRALAEKLRTAFYFVACGEHPDTNVNKRKLYHRDRTWVERVYNEIIYGLPMVTRPELPPLKEYSDFITLGWVQGQIDYHMAKAEREHRKNHNLKKLGMWSFILAITISCIHLVFAAIGAYGHHAEGLALIVEEVLSIFAITLPAAGAAFSGYRSLMEQSRIAARSKAMASHLSQIREQIATHDPVSLRHYLERIEDTILIESEDWLTLMEHAELERIA